MLRLEPRQESRKKVEKLRRDWGGGALETFRDMEGHERDVCSVL